MDDGIFYGTYKEEINQVIEERKKSGPYIEYKGDIEDYLGSNVYFMEY